MVYSLLLFLVLTLSMILQEFIPAIPWAHGAIVFLVPVVFFACAVTVPFPVMLVFAFFTGFIWDARHLAILGPEFTPKMVGAGEFATEGTSLAFGYSILLFGLLGSLMQGIRPLFRRGRWELPVLMTGVGTFLFMLFEYLLITFRRGGFHFPSEIWYRMLATAVLSMVIAPGVLFLLYRLAKATEYRIKYEGLRGRSF